MTDTTAAYHSVGSFDSRSHGGGGRALVRMLRAVGGVAATGIAATIAVGVLIIAVTLTAAWLANSGRSQAPRGPGAWALAPADAAHPTFEAKWARSTGAVQIVAVPRQATVAALAPPPRALAERAAPLPRSRPSGAPAAQAPVDVAQAPVTPLAPVEPKAVPLATPQAAPQAAPPPVVAVAAAAPVAPAPPEKRATPQLVHNKGPALPDPDARTAVYDISARTVYLPSGKKLEAHSGLGEKMDDPRHVHVRMRGATPPNVYDLTMREKLFHGVRALRLNPVDRDKMFGRDGILAHSYMLGPNGQSNGCVSFKDYDAFLQAYLDGEIDRLVVVPHLGDGLPVLTARAPRKTDRRYASYDRVDVRRDSSW